MPTNFELKQLKLKLDIVEKAENREHKLTDSNVSRALARVGTRLKGFMYTLYSEVPQSHQSSQALRREDARSDGFVPNNNCLLIGQKLTVAVQTRRARRRYAPPRREAIRGGADLARAARV